MIELDAWMWIALYVLIGIVLTRTLNGLSVIDTEDEEGSGIMMVILWPLVAMLLCLGAVVKFMDWAVTPAKDDDHQH